MGKKALKRIYTKELTLPLDIILYFILEKGAKDKKVLKLRGFNHFYLILIIFA